MTEGYAADWTVEQLREPAQRIADRIDELMGAAGGPEPVETSSAPEQVILRSRSHGAGGRL